jgi:nucleoside 2-deoxyribosyltransferase
MQDSGERRQFETGAVRDRGGHKPRPDLISPHANLREGEWLRQGAEKYTVDNWCKGMPIRECVASLARHLEAYKLGLQDEDHMAAIRTNAGFILHYEEEIKAGRLPASLDDMPKYATPPKVTLVYPLQAERERLHQDEDFITPPGTPESGGVFDNTVSAIQLLDLPDAAFKEIEKPFTVYLCGPITGQKVDWLWRDAATAFLGNYGINTLNPLRGKDPSKVSNQGLSYDGQLASTEMVNRDRIDVEEANMILAHFPYMPPRQSIGSLMEMGMATRDGKPILLCTTLEEFNQHLFTRKFCVIEPDFQKALNLIVEVSHASGR